MIMAIFREKKENKQETADRIRETVIKCFSEVAHVPAHTITDDTDFFEDFSTDSMDYFVLLSKIKSSFVFPIKDKLISGQTTVKGFCKKIQKAAR